MTGRRIFKGAFLLAVVMFALLPVIASFAGTINYTYDELNRLKTEEYGEESNKTIIEYQYDKLGNRTHRIVTLPTYTVSTAILEGAGSISPTSASVTKGSNTAFTVTPNTGYHIASVTGCGGALSGNTYTTGAITVDCTVTATFEINSYLLTVVVNTTGVGLGGSISSSPAGMNCNGSTCSAIYAHGQVILTANANDGYRFTGWEGICTGTGTCIVDMSEGKSVQANFIQIFTIDASVQSTANGSITPYGTTIMDYGSNMSFTINANGYSFINTVVISNPSSQPPVNVALPTSGPIVYTFSNVRENYTIWGSFICPDPLPQARIPKAVPEYYSTIQEALIHAVDGDVIQTHAPADNTGNHIGIVGINKSVTLDGGYSCRYNEKSGQSELMGMITVSDGTVTISDFEVKQ